MADTPAQVSEFLYTLAQRAKPYAERDMEELLAYADKLGLTDMQAWDVGFVSEQLRQEKYAFSDQEVKQYFPEEKCWPVYLKSPKLFLAYMYAN